AVLALISQLKADAAARDAQLTAVVSSLGLLTTPEDESGPLSSEVANQTGSAFDHTIGTQLPQYYDAVIHIIQVYLPHVPASEQAALQNALTSLQADQALIANL